jgi:hypothetical protein
MKIISSITCLSVIVMMLQVSCNKSPCKCHDFRDKYVGKYSVKEEVTSYGFPECGDPYHWIRDTVISVNYGATDSTLEVLGRDLFIDSTGYYYSYHYSLRLWNDSLLSYFMNGGLGCGQYEVFKGTRASTTP